MNASSNDLQQFKDRLKECKAVFEQKVQEYGAAFRILRISSITDILYIKICRIRSIEAKGTQKVADSVRLDYVSLVNYSLMALIQLRHNVPEAPMEATDLPWSALEAMYDDEIARVASLLLKKNHDYNAAWKDLRLSAIHDILLMRMLRLKHKEETTTNASSKEERAENYQDIVNYAVFCMAKLNESAHP